MAWVCSDWPMGMGEPTEPCRCGQSATHHVVARRVDTQTGEVFRRYAAMCAACRDSCRANQSEPPPPQQDDEP